MKTFLFLTACLLGFLPALRAQEFRVQNVPTRAAYKPVASGPSVVGAFDGRLPSAEIAKDWKVTIRPETWKVKWRLTLYQDSTTHEPTTYHLLGTLDRSAARQGKWTIVRGTKTDPNAIVYQLDADKPEVSVYLLKGDDDVLFILDQQRNFRVGTIDLSYTLNRIVN